MIVAVVLIVLALVYYLVATIVALQRITAGLDEVIADVTGIVEKSAPVNGIVSAINQQLDAGVDLLEGLLVKKAGLVDAVGLVDGLYPGAAAAGFRNFPGSDSTSRRRGSARSIRRARSPSRASAARRRSPPRAPTARRCGTSRAAAWPPDCSIPSCARRARKLPRSPVIGTDAPVQYEQREDIGAPRKRLPSRS